jgi:putative FmdB family regulatory protein
MKLPIYEYQCNQCGEILEVFQGINDGPLEKCEQCSGKVTKLISNCTFQLKGTGWYLTDYARKESYQVSGDKKAGEKHSEKKSAEKKSKEKKETAKNTKTN